MKNKILTPIILALLVFNYSYCITNEKAECLYQKRRELNGIPFDDCESMLFAAAVVPSALQYKSSQDIIMLTCLLDYSVKFNCRNKSVRMPVLGDNDWGRGEDE